MTASLQPESKSPSRRAVLAAALGGAAAMVARTVIQPSSARAAGDDNSPILVGSTFLNVQTGTYLSDTVTDATVLSGVSSSAGGHGAGIGVLGASGSGTGVHGESDSGNGVFGHSDTAPGVAGTSTSSSGVFGGSFTDVGVFGSSSSSKGVQGESSSGTGVYGISQAANQPATVGHSSGDSTGVQGVTGGFFPAAPPKTGVHGYAAQDSGKGIWGESLAGHGVHGSTTSGFAGYFAGKVYTSKFVEMTEITAPAAPGLNKARLFLRDNGSGLTQLCVRFNTGTIKVLATQT
jgi:hypothetical protein